MREYITIKAFDLETRCWIYHPTYGYGCSECCTGDRCDEDCAAKYKGNRKGCPHCKGKGWISPDDANEREVLHAIDNNKQKEDE